MITIDELKKIAALAKLSLDGEDIEALQRDIGNVLDFADAVSKAAVDVPDGEADGSEQALREDVLLPSFPAEDILRNAGEQQDGYFVARKRGGLPL